MMQRRLDRDCSTFRRALARPERRACDDFFFSRQPRRVVVAAQGDTAAARDLLGVARTRSRLRLLGITDIGQKRHLTRAFDRDRHLVLVFPAGTRVAAAPNPAPLGDETAKLRDVLVIDCRDLLLAEEAGPPAP